MRLGWIRDERGLDPRGLIYRKVCLWGDLFFFVPPFNCFGFLLRSGSAGSHGNKLFLYFLKLFFYFYSDLSACKMADYSWWF